MIDRVCDELPAAGAATVEQSVSGRVRAGRSHRHTGNLLGCRSTRRPNPPPPPPPCYRAIADQYIHYSRLAGCSIATTDHQLAIHCSHRRLALCAA